MSEENIREIMKQVSGQGLESMVLFTKEGTILKKTCNEEKAHQIINETLKLLDSIDHTITEKFESSLQLQSIRARGGNEYIYIFSGGEYILSLLQERSLSQEEKEMLQEAKKIENLF